MKKFLAMAIPVLPGQTERARKFVNTLKTRYQKEYLAYQEEYGVYERTLLQQNPNGDLLLVTLEGRDPEGAFANWGIGNDAFSKYCTAETKAIHGINLSTQALNKFPELLLESQELQVASAR